MSHHLVGAAEVAKILGVTRQRVAQLAVSEGFPTPEIVLSAGRIWLRTAIEAWAAAHPERGHAAAVDDQGWAMHRLQKVAYQEATDLGHHHLGVEHFVLAMLRPECPGVARQVLESFGLTHGEVRERVVEACGPPGDPKEQWVKHTPQLLVMCERAKLQAALLADPVVTSEHFLLAITDDGEHWHWSLGSPVTSDAVRERAMALTNSGTFDEPVSAEYLRRRNRVASTRLKGVHSLPRYMSRADGVEPELRKPWGSVLWSGESWHSPGQPIQYTVDREGVPVLGPTGRPFSHAVDDEGFPVVDDEHFGTQAEFDVPDGGWLKWPEGVEPPAGAHPSVVAAFERQPR